MQNIKQEILDKALAFAKDSGAKIIITNDPKEAVSNATVVTTDPLHDAALGVAQSYRQICLEKGLLDFSLQIELFNNVLMKNEIYTDYLRDKFRYLIVDNAEENYPIVMDFVEWIWDSLEM